jgi:hypothetical protein
MAFPISSEEPVITTSYVTDDRLPILYVSHDRDDDAESGGSWQFHCGNNDYSESRLRLVGLGTILLLDPSLRQLADLPIGYGAHRVATNAPWEYRKEE